MMNTKKKNEGKHNMEAIKSYLTKEGWKKNLQNTSEDFSNMHKASKLDDLVRNENGQVAAAALITVAAMPLCAHVGSYIGGGFGWISGNIIDLIPYVDDVAPWLAKRYGLINDTKNISDLNENLYQTTGAISGFWGGLLLPLQVLAASVKNKR